MRTIFAAVILFLALPALAQDLIGPADIIDGDTIDVQGVRVRLWGIDAPEAGTVAGDAATAFLRDLMDGETVSCRDTGGRSYRRIVAQCFIGDLDIADALVDAGHARDWPKYSSGYYAR